MRLNINPDQSIAFIGDIHCDTVAPSSRTDLDYMKTLRNKMMLVLARCKEENVALAVLLGDVFNRIAVTNECKNNIINIIKTLLFFWLVSFCFSSNLFIFYFYCNLSLCLLSILI